MFEAMKLMPATPSHDAGAYVRCLYCRRYSMDRRTLDRAPPACECGHTDGWSGIFIEPGPDAKWSKT